MNDARMILRSSGPAAAPRCRKGFTLVELMVSIAIGLVIVAALIALFVNTSRTNREIAKANNLIENGRIATQLLQNDIVHAGYWGTHVPRFDDLVSAGVPDDVPPDLTVTPPDPCLAFDPANWTAGYINTMIAVPLQVYDDAAVCAGVITDKVPDTDVLVVRHADTCPPGVGECAADTAGQLYVQSSLCPDDAVRVVVDTAGFALRQRDCATVTEKRRFVSNIFYVRDFAVTAGDGIPTLVRSQFDLVGGTLSHQPATPMVEGVESFRVELGVDSESETGEAVDYASAVLWADPTTRKTLRNRGDGVPDGDFLRCTTATPCTIGELMNTVAVRLHVLARSREESRSFDDEKTYVLGSAPTVCPTTSTDAGCDLKSLDPNIKRHLFSTTVRLPNISGRRETPL